MVSRRAAWAVAIVAMLTMSVSDFDRGTLAVLAPSVTKALGISEKGYGVLTAAFSAAYLLATPLGGKWIDRVGARRGLLYSVLAWSSVAALQALAPGLGVLIGLRLALGVAEGPGFPGSAQTMLRVLPPEDRSRGFGVLFSGSSIGAMAAPPIAGFLYDLAGWRVAMLGTACIGLLWIPVWLALTGRPAIAAKLGAAVAATESGPRPTMRQLAAHPIMVRALIAIFAVAPPIGFFIAWGPKYLVQHYGVTQGHVGRYLWLPPLACDAGAILFGDLAARQRRPVGVPPRALFVVGALLTASVALMPMAGTPWQLVAVASVTGAGTFATYTLVTADMLVRMPAGSVSTAAGVLAGAQSLALVISSPLIGWALDRFGSYEVVAIALGVWVVPGSLVWWLWRPAAHFEKAAA